MIAEILLKKQSIFMKMSDLQILLIKALQACNIHRNRIFCNKNIAKVSKAHIPRAVAIRGHTTLIGKKKKGQITVLISNMWLILLYTVQLVISDVCTKS